MEKIQANTASMGQYHRVKHMHTDNNSLDPTHLDMLQSPLLLKHNQNVLYNFPSHIYSIYLITYTALKLFQHAKCFVQSTTLSPYLFVFFCIYLSVVFNTELLIIVQVVRYFTTYN